MPKLLTREDIAREADDSDNDDDVNDANIPKVVAQEKSNRIKYDKKGYSRAPKQRGYGKGKKRRFKKNSIGRKEKRRRPLSMQPHSSKSAKSISLPVLTPPTKSNSNKSTPQPRKSGYDKTRLKQERLLISSFYDLVLQCPPPQGWSGAFGTIATIMRALKFNGANRNKVKAVVKETHDKYINRLTYDGKIKHSGGKPAKIKHGSTEEHILADGKEDGMSNEDVCVCVNEYREDKSLPCIGVNAIIGALERMEPKKVGVTKQNHGSDDESSDWARARYNFYEANSHQNRRDYESQFD